MTTQTLWKDSLDTALKHHLEWWDHKSLVLWLTSPADRPLADVTKPATPDSLRNRWFDPVYCARAALYTVSHTYWGGDSLPMGGVWKAAGDLGPMLGAPVELSPNTIWMNPIITKPEGADDRPLRFDPDNAYVCTLMAIAREMVRVSEGRFMVAFPDLVENIDVLASLRGTEDLLMDMVERPEWVERKVWEINRAFYEAFDFFLEVLKDDRGGNIFVFSVWGLGKTAKVQCDACSMFGPEMFRRFVSPALTEQCDWLDYALYHLDGETCLSNLDALLEIEPLQAIEWTPMFAYSTEGGGHPKWYDLYRRIKKAGKSVQAICVKPNEVIPLLDAVGPEGMFITCAATSESEARALEEKVAAYR
ncbi:MAG: hypothetical protein GC164_08940 [Phycisphaera sp.]|nr:hypothetical protein [Phycisphaera sp.]